jgi:hypothetical protein
VPVLRYDVVKALKNSNYDQSKTDLVDMSNVKRSGKDLESYLLWGVHEDNTFKFVTELPFHPVTFKFKDQTASEDTIEKLICEKKAGKEDEGDKENSLLWLWITIGVVFGLVIIGLVVYCVWFRNEGSDDEPVSDFHDSEISDMDPISAVRY